MDNREIPCNSRVKLQRARFEDTFVVYSKIKNFTMKKITTRVDHYARLIILITALSAYIGVLVAAAL